MITWTGGMILVVAYVLAANVDRVVRCAIAACVDLYRKHHRPKCEMCAEPAAGKLCSLESSTTTGEKKTREIELCQTCLTESLEAQGREAVLRGMSQAGDSLGIHNSDDDDDEGEDWKSER